MEKRPPNYLAYLLRCWREGEELPWRASLEDPHTGEVIGFASLQHLYHFLDQQTGKSNPTQNHPARPGSF